MTEPIKVLRAADAFTGQTPEHRATAAPDPFAGRAAEFVAWEATASVEKLKERFKTDPIFADWYSRRGGL